MMKLRYPTPIGECGAKLFFQLFLLKMLSYIMAFHSIHCWSCTNWLRIFTVEKLENNILQETIPLSYTPRHFTRHPENPLLYVVEADHGILSAATRAKLLNDPNVVNGDAEELPPQDFGYPRGRGHWASCIQVVDPVDQKAVLETIELEENEAAVSVAAVPFTSQDNETFLIVGTGKDMVPNPRSYSCGFIHVYRFQEDGKSLEFIHKTKVEAPPLALLAFQGRLLAGIETELLIFDLGMRQLLRKSQAPITPNLITGLQTQGSRIIVSDVQESVTFVVYKYQENRLIPFIDDSIARWTTCTAMVDYETVAGGDKFGNLWLVRCPNKVSEASDEEGSGAHLLHERGYLQGTAHRLDLMAHYFTQDIPTAMQKVQLVSGGREVLLWAGLQGNIGVFAPFQSREDVDFFQSLEGHLRSEDPPLAGRDHLMYRGYYVPVKGVIDGDLCERFLVLGRDVKERIAAELDRSVREVERKISDMRTRHAY
jgi:splicing factor 3B subunit 3